MTEAERKIFAETGILGLKGFIPRKAVAIVKDSILAELDRLKLREKGKLSSAKLQSLPVFQQTGKLSQMVKLGPELDGLFSAELLGTMNALAGVPLKAAAPRPQLLLSFPNKEEWSLGGLNWHLDLAVPKKDELPGVQAFLLIDDLQPRGGATLAIAGSHRLHYVPEARNGNAHAVLRKDALFGALFEGPRASAEKLMKPHSIHGVDVSVVEFCGKAGDVFLMDLRVLHSPSLNGTKNVRMMTTSRFLKTGISM
ncbi:phytanoyl-CoA dioxygenase family protein [Archangium gephyra]|nr:phytanoyl-CoA dioxygenase family protein [Archangium gephyra]